MKKNWRHHYSHLLNILIQYHAKLNAGEVNIPCEAPTAAVIMCGCDDKSNIAVGSTVPLEATPRQSNRAILPQDTTLEACDHNFEGIHKINPTVIHHMNQSTNPGDSLYSGGPHGTGRAFVSLHDSLLDPSDGMKHSAHMLSFLKILARERSANNVKSLAYRVLLECDGGPDHNLTHLHNQLALVGLFLEGNMDKLDATRGTPGLSYLNVGERPMSLLNLGLSSLSLIIGPDAGKWLLDILSNVSSMKGMCNRLREYDDIIPHVIEALERRVARLDSNNNATNDTTNAEEDEDNVLAVDTGTSTMDGDELHVAKVGETIIKFFPFHGRHEGTVVDVDGTQVHITYVDGDNEVMSQDDLNKVKEKAAIPIGAVGMEFIKKFGRDYYNGKVVRILASGKRVCKFHDGDIHQYSLDQLEKYSKNTSNGVNLYESDDDDDTEDEDDMIEVEDDEDDSDEESELTVAAPAMSGNLLRQLTRLPHNTSCAEYLDELKNIRSAHDEYSHAMSYPMEQVAKRFSNLQLDGRPVEVVDWTKEEEVESLKDALKKFDPAYDIKYRSKSQVSKMLWIEKLLNCPHHCCHAQFTFELRLCGRNGCDICAHIGRTIRAPNVTVGEFNIQSEVLRWMDLPVVNPSDTNHYLSALDARKAIDRKDLSLEDLIKFLPSKKNDTEEKRIIQQLKDKDKKHTFAATKLRLTVVCDDCGAHRGIYSDHAVGTPKGPTKNQLQSLERSLENGYSCGKAVKSSGGFFVKRQLTCGDYIESQYYNPTTGLKGGRILTPDICAICYDMDEIVSVDEIRREKNIGGKNPLLICRYCFDKNIEVPCSGGRTNVKQNSEQAKTGKKRRHDEQVMRGRRKVRNNPSYAGDLL